MSKLRRQMEIDMLLGNYAENTRKIYLDVICKFEDHFDGPVEEAGVEDIRAYLHHLVERNLSESSLKQAYSALELISEVTLGKPWDVKRIPRARKKKKLPVILSQAEVEAILQTAPSLKYNAIFTTIYSAGLRTSEVAQLKLTDIDSVGVRIRVDQGKGYKDRFTLLARTTLELLRAYWMTRRPPEWLFTPDTTDDHPISERTIQGASRTLLTLAADPKHLGAQIGFIAVLHTWSQTLAYHPHLHCIVTGGGLSPDLKHWVAASPDFFIHVNVLGALFRGKLLDALKAAVDRDNIQTDPNTSWKSLLATLYHMKWNVDCREPFDGADHVVEYMGRYTHRVAISNHRITAIGPDHVSFRYRDPHDPAKTRHMALPALEFIRRFLQHVLPTGFVKIRHYGILANRNRKACISRARVLLLVHPQPESPTPLPWHELLQTLTGTNPFQCPYCSKGTLLLKARLQPLRAPPPILSRCA